MLAPLPGVLPSAFFCCFSQRGGPSSCLALFFSHCFSKSYGVLNGAASLGAAGTRGSSGGLRALNQVCGALAGKGKAVVISHQHSLNVLCAQDPAGPPLPQLSRL